MIAPNFGDKTRLMVDSLFYHESEAKIIGLNLAYSISPASALTILSSVPDERALMVIVSPGWIE